MDPAADRAMDPAGDQANLRRSMRGFTDESAPHQIVLRAHGVALRVCASTPDILARIEPYLPPGWRAVQDSAAHRMGIVGEDGGKFAVYDENRPIDTGKDLRVSLAVLDTHMRMHIAINARDKTFVHAGVAGHRGHAIVIPGHSGSGKTTLVVALVRAGASYYSDEFAVLDDDGLVHAYPRRPSPSRLGDPPPLGDDIDWLEDVPPIPLGVVVFTHYVEGASWNPEPVAAGRAALAMIENAVPARIRPEATMTAVSRALRGAIALEGERGEAPDVAEAVLALSGPAASP
jgi:hypothetical protein